MVVLADDAELAPVKVAVIDSGIDGTHPDLAGPCRRGASRSSAARRTTTSRATARSSPARSPPTRRTAIGMAGLAFNARLIVAKVVAADGDVSLPAEVAAIRWAVDQGARVINLSLGGVRDPLDPSLDTYSPLEQAAVEYAYSKGAVVVAAVGNGTQSPSTPWRYAALSGGAAARDRRQRGAPRRLGPGLLEPRRGLRRRCSTRRRHVLDDPARTSSPTTRAARTPYSDCGPFEFRDAIGTSFAAPQVSAAAALLLGVDPVAHARPGRVALERSADDASDAHRLRRVRDRPRRAHGLGDARRRERARRGSRSALPLPRPDRYEPNDDAGAVGAHAPAAATHRSTRRSTTGTTTSTSTASG